MTEVKLEAVNKSTKLTDIKNLPILKDIKCSSIKSGVGFHVNQRAVIIAVEMVNTFNPRLD